MKIGMGFDQPHRLTAIRCLQHSRVVRQFLENATQRVANQGVIVDRKILHPGCLFGWSRQEYFNPCQKSSVARKRSIARPSSRKTASTILNEIQQFSALQ